MRKSPLFIAAFTVSLAAGACAGKASEEDCKKFSEHFAALMVQGQEGPAAEITKQVADGMKEQNYQECVEKGTKKETDCILKATTMEDAIKCDSSRVQ